MADPSPDTGAFNTGPTESCEVSIKRAAAGLASRTTATPPAPSGHGQEQHLAQALPLGKASRPNREATGPPGSSIRGRGPQRVNQLWPEGAEITPVLSLVAEKPRGLRVEPDRTFARRSEADHRETAHPELRGTGPTLERLGRLRSR